jgi:hypothetical protein
MKNLIRKILNESVDNRIVDVLIKMNLSTFSEIDIFLEEVGYSDDEIIEIYHNYFKTISGLELNPTNWMDFYFSPDQLEFFEDDNYPNTLFIKKNGKVVMEKDKNFEENKYKIIFIDYRLIWSVLNNLFFMKDTEVTNFLNEWLEENFKIKNYKPVYQSLSTI